MRLVFFCLILVFSQCAKKTSNSTSQMKIDSVALNKLIENELGPLVEKLPNKSNTYLLVYKLKAVSENFSSYAVFEVASGKVVKKGNYSPGYIRWLDDAAIELLSVPGTIQSAKNLEDFKQIISIENEKK